MYLYSKDVPGGMLTVVVHSGLSFEYLVDADRKRALEVSQLPS